MTYATPLLPLKHLLDVTPRIVEAYSRLRNSHRDHENLLCAQGIYGPLELSALERLNAKFEKDFRDELSRCFIPPSCYALIAKKADLGSSLTALTGNRLPVKIEFNAEGGKYAEYAIDLTAPETGLQRVVPTSLVQRVSSFFKGEF